MRVRFFFGLDIPSYETELPAVPRVGETIDLDYIRPIKTFVVVSVAWRVLMIDAPDPEAPLATYSSVTYDCVFVTCSPIDANAPKRWTS